MPEQSEKCLQEHKVLKEMLEEFREEFDKWKDHCKKIQCFFFGGMHQAEKGEVSFIDKVNIMYENQNNSRSYLMWFIGVFGTLIIGAIFGLGIELNKIDNTVNTLATVVQKQQNIEIEIAEIKAKMLK